MNKIKFLALISLMLFLGITEKSKAAEGDTTSIRVHNAINMNWWGQYNQWGVFPAPGTTYRRINLDFTLGCPPTGCSDWDYTVQVEALHKTGALDSTLESAPLYVINGASPDTIFGNSNPVYEYFFNTTTQSVDSTLAASAWVMIYNDPTDPTLLTDSTFLYEAGFYNYIFNSSGTIIDSVLVGYDTALINVFTPYYDVFEVVERIELARVITPYGGYYNTSWSNTIHFDVTDFADILRDSVEIRAFYGGWSDGFAITLDFHFIEGTPPRTPINIHTVYNSGPGGFPYGNTSNPIENYLVPKTFNTSANESMAMLRIIPTGHGAGTQNCAEFCQKNYRIKLDGIQQFQQAIWRNDCGLNHLMHQAGTWLYDRANWCPGEKGSIKEHEITGLYTPGNPVTVDMDIDAYTNLVSGQNPNYIMAAQLITYSAPNFSVDASMEEILSPNNDFYYNRFNPICNNPLIAIKNTGSTTLTSATITYGIKGATPSVFNWTGSLDFNKTVQVQLGALDWNSVSNQSEQFYAYISNPNGTTDQYAYNDTMYTTVKFPVQHPYSFVILFKTNNAYTETTYNIKDDLGNIVHTNGIMAANTIYRDTVVLSPGCYSFNVNDSGKDGLNFFANSDGAGYVRFVNAFGPGVLQFFEADFGTRFTQNFTVGYLLNEPEIMQESMMQVFPNPSSGDINIDLAYPVAETGDVFIMDAVGKIVFQKHFENEHNPVINADLNHLSGGIYFVRATTEKSNITKRVIIQPAR
ncbi:MAG: T9SS type A sorting domain-containing protein [Bacteroidia bacterium]|nr:T9SS type A sorting domain-containing protein [Bacteroidia bacterium]